MVKTNTDLIGKLVAKIKKRQRTIFVIGDAMVDRWISGRQLHCQDNCKKLVQSDVSETPGGAHNAANCLSNWNVKVWLWCQWEEDRCVKTRIMEGDRIILRVDEDKRADPDKYAKLYRRCLKLLSAADGVLLSDYDKGFLSEGFLRAVIQRCSDRSIPVVADCKRPPDTYRGAILKGNKDYWSRYSAPDHIHPVVATCGDFLPYVSYPGTSVIGTCSQDLPRVKCVNHVGAGDCFASHLILALTYWFPFNESVAIAHSAGRVYVQHPRNRPPHPFEIASDMTTAK